MEVEEEARARRLAELEERARHAEDLVDTGKATRKEVVERSQEARADRERREKEGIERRLTEVERENRALHAAMRAAEEQAERERREGEAERQRTEEEMVAANQRAAEDRAARNKAAVEEKERRTAAMETKVVEEYAAVEMNALEETVKSVSCPSSNCGSS